MGCIPNRCGVKGIFYTTVINIVWAVVLGEFGENIYPKYSYIRKYKYVAPKYMFGE